MSHVNFLSDNLYSYRKMKLKCAKTCKYEAKLGRKRWEGKCVLISYNSIFKIYLFQVRYASYACYVCLYACYVCLCK